MLELGKSYQVKVVKILDKGAIVSVPGSESTEFIHISKLSSAFVSKVSDAVSVGDTIMAKCIKNTQLNKLELSPRDFSEHSLYIVEDDSNRTSNTKPDSKRLDTMIRAANKAFQEKQKATDSRARRRCKR